MVSLFIGSGAGLILFMVILAQVFNSKSKFIIAKLMMGVWYIAYKQMNCLRIYWHLLTNRDKAAELCLANNLNTCNSVTTTKYMSSLIYVNSIHGTCYSLYRVCWWRFIVMS